MSQTRRGFLGYLLGTGAGALTSSACQIVPATAADVKKVEDGDFDFACLPRDGVVVKEMTSQACCQPIEITSAASPYRQWLPGLSWTDLTIRMSIRDPKRGAAIAKFFLDRIGKSI